MADFMKGIFVGIMIGYILYYFRYSTQLRAMKEAVPSLVRLIAHNQNITRNITTFIKTHYPGDKLPELSPEEAQQFATIREVIDKNFNRDVDDEDTKT